MKKGLFKATPEGFEAWLVDHNQRAIEWAFANPGFENLGWWAAVAPKDAIFAQICLETDNFKSYFWTNRNSGFAMGANERGYQVATDSSNDDGGRTVSVYANDGFPWYLLDYYARQVQFGIEPVAGSEQAVRFKYMEDTAKTGFSSAGVTEYVNRWNARYKTIFGAPAFPAEWATGNPGIDPIQDDGSTGLVPGAGRTTNNKKFPWLLILGAAAAIWYLTQNEKNNG